MKLHPKIKQLQIDAGREFAHAGVRAGDLEDDARKAEEAGDAARALKLYREASFQRGIQKASEQIHSRLHAIEWPSKKAPVVRSPSGMARPRQ